MKRSFILFLLALGMVACANHQAPAAHASATSSHDYVKPGAIDIPGYTTETSK